MRWTLRRCLSGDLVRVPSMNWTLSSKLSVRYYYDRMILRFYETEPSDSEEETNPPLLSVVHGEQDFQGFYDFLMKIIPINGTRDSLVRFADGY
jgi:hypothetical protein